MTMIMIMNEAVRMPLDWLLPPHGVPTRTPMHPGKLLDRTCLQPLLLNQTQAARLLGLSRRRLHELVHGQRAMSPDTAIRCAKQFGIDAQFWLSLQAAWDSFFAWKKHRMHQHHRMVYPSIRAIAPSMS